MDRKCPFDTEHMSPQPTLSSLPSNGSLSSHLPNHSTLFLPSVIFYFSLSKVGKTPQILSWKISDLALIKLSHINLDSGYSPLWQFPHAFSQRPYVENLAEMKILTPRN